MFGIALAAGAGALAVGLSVRSFLAQVRLAPRDVAENEKKLESGRDAEAARVIDAVFDDAAPAMVESLMERSDHARRLGAVAIDEFLGDVDRKLSSFKSVPSAAIRVAFLSSGLGAIIELAGDLSGVGLVNALPAAVAGLGSAAVCFELGRKSARDGSRIRTDWDRLAAAAAKRIGAVGAEPPAFGRARQARSSPSGSRRPRTSRGAGSE